MAQIESRLWSVGELIAKARRDAGVRDQATFAAMVGVSVRTVSRWETNQAMPTLSQVRDIISATNAAWLWDELKVTLFPYLDAAFQVVIDPQPRLPFALPPASVQPVLTVAG